MIQMMKKTTFFVALLLFVLFISRQIVLANDSDYTTKEPSNTTKIDGVKYYVIESAEEIAFIAEQGGDWLTYCYLLNNDIVLNDVTFTFDDNGNPTNELSTLRKWKPIGEFSGILDGDGHSISGLYINCNSNGLAGFISVLEGGTIKNLTVKNAFVNDQYGSGGICAISKGTITDCSFYGSVKGGNYVGGIAGSSSECLYRNDTCSGYVSGDTSVGGISGETFHGIFFSCRNEATVSGKDYVGGIFGKNDSVRDDASDCINEGKIICNGMYCGGIAGSFTKSSISEQKNLFNFGAVYGKQYVGGIIGYNSVRLSGCKNKGMITGETNVGGISGYIDKGSITKAINIGSVSANESVGGVCGFLTGGGIWDAYNLSSVFGKTNVGGVVGYSDSIWGRGTVSNCYYLKTEEINAALLGFGNDDEDDAVVTKALKQEDVCTTDDDFVPTHTWKNDYTVDKEPTRTEDGSESIHCSVCDAKKPGSERPVEKLERVLFHEKCGEKAEFSVIGVKDDFGNIDSPTLIITGTGSIYDYDYHYNRAPWRSYDIEKIIIEEGIERIGNFTFSGYEKLNEVILPDSLRSIGEAAFEVCTNIGKIDFPDNLKKIEDYAFHGCSGIKEINLPETLLELGTDAFADCTGIETVEMPISVQNVNSGLFSGCRSLKKVTLHEGLKSIGSYAFCGCENLKTISLPNTIESIGTGAFLGSGIESISIPPNVTEIKESTFSCENLREVFLHNNISRIEDYAICGSKISNITLPVSVIEFGRWALGNQVENLNITVYCKCPAREAVLSQYPKTTIIEHTWEQGCTIDIQPTCTEEGSESIHCSVCDAVKEGTAREIEKLPHSYGEWMTTAEPTCVTDGIKEKVCINCNDKVTEAVPSSGHQWDADYTIDEPATCTTDGKKSIHCKNCAEVKDSVVIESTGHAYGDWIVIKEATCVQTGSQEKICIVCGDKLTQEMPKTDHPWDADYTIDEPATCTTDGRKSIHCKNCAEVKDSEVIAASGHAYGNWVIIKKATCEKTGRKEKNCTVCGEKITKKLPKKGHQWNEAYTVDKAATYASAGSKSIHCSVCDVMKPDSAVSIKKLKLQVPTLSKPTAAKRRFSVKWKKVSEATGYEVQYALDSKFTKSKKTVKITKAATNSKKVTNLKAEKKYYVRIRAYKTVQGKTYYSTWSKAKTVTTKK